MSQSPEILTITALLKESLHPRRGEQPAEIIRGRARFRRDQCAPVARGDTGIYAPVEGAKPVSQNQANFFFVSELETLQSDSAWRKQGRKVKQEEQPVRLLRRSVGGGRKIVEYGVFRESQTEPMRTVKVNPPLVLEDLRLAIFVINRSAKRYRDAAAKAYAAGNHQTARQMRVKKEELYVLKDAGIRHAIKTGMLIFEGQHGKLGLWTGGGFVFHSPLVPEDYIARDSSEDKPILVEAKPRDAKLPRLCDAIQTLRAVPPVRLSELGLRTVVVPHYK